MGMYICGKCQEQHPYLDMSSSHHGANCEICQKSSICTFTWDLDRFPEEGVTIQMQLKKLKEKECKSK